MYKLQPQKKTNPLVIILAIIGGITVVLVGLVFLSGIGLSRSMSAASTPQRVVYQIHSTECTEFSVTYEMPGGTAQKDVTACPGGGQVDSFAGSSGDFVYLSIQNIGNRNSRAIFTCNIQVNGRLAAQVQSSGFANIASCSGSLE